MTDPSDLRLSSPAAFRNRVPILDVLRTVLARSGLVLEVASGSGQHVVYFAERLPKLAWQPSDPSAGARSSIAAWIAAEGLANVRSPLDLNASAPPWPLVSADAIAAINMVRISPWSATEGLMREAGRLLPQGGRLYLYGPFIRSEVATAPRNIALDADLRQRDPAWGLRDITDIETQAALEGLRLESAVEMPANNLSVILRRR